MVSRMEILNPEQLMIFPYNTKVVILLLAHSIWSLFSFSFTKICKADIYHYI